MHKFNRKCDGITILEIVVCMAIIGVLVSIVLPAIGSVRESSRRAACLNHLRQLGIALHSHHNKSGSLPPGMQETAGAMSAYGWATKLLEDLELTQLANSIDFDLPVTDARNSLAAQSSQGLFLCPSDVSEPSFPLVRREILGWQQTVGNGVAADMEMGETIGVVQLPTSNYIGVFGTLDPDESIPTPNGNGAFIDNKSHRFRDFQRGLGCTLIVGERTMARLPSTWFGVALDGEDAAGRLLGAALAAPNAEYSDECEFSSRHPGGANFLWGDGHANLISETIEKSVYLQSARLSN